MSSYTSDGLLPPLHKRDDYYNYFPSTITHKGRPYKQLTKTDGRWCESKNHEGRPHALTCDESSLHTAGPGYLQYKGGRIVDTSKHHGSSCLHSRFDMDVFGVPPGEEKFVRPVDVPVGSEAVATVGATSYDHALAVTLSTIRLRSDPEDVLAQEVIDKHKRYGDRIGVMSSSSSILHDNSHALS